MRLFIALELPDTVITELEKVQQRLQERGPHPVRWVRSTGFHLTLHFLGEVDETQVPGILAVVEQARTGLSTERPTHLHLTGIWAFPHPRRPQTLWVGVGGDLDTLNHVYDTLSAGLEPLGFEAEKRPFHAHLTLGRVRRDATSAQRKVLEDALFDCPYPDAVSWPLSAPVLFKSTLTPKGPIYHKMGDGE